MSSSSITRLPPWTQSLVDIEQNYSKDAIVDKTFIGNVKYGLFGRILVMTKSMTAHAESIWTGANVCFLLGKSIFQHVDEQELNRRIEECQNAYSVVFTSFRWWEREPESEPELQPPQPNLVPLIPIQDLLSRNESAESLVHFDSSRSSEADALVIEQASKIDAVQFQDNHVFFGSKEFFAQCSLPEMLSKINQNQNAQSQALAVYIISNNLLGDAEFVAKNLDGIVLRTALLNQFNSKRIASHDNSNDISPFSEINDDDGKDLSLNHSSSQSSFEVIPDDEVWKQQGPITNNINVASINQDHF